MDFAITPRINDDHNFIQMVDLHKLWDPLHSGQTVPFRDGVTGHNRISDDSEVQNTDKQFRIRLDLRHFKPEEVKIKADNLRVSVHAKHEEKQDSHGCVAREITRVYRVPGDVDVPFLTSTMNAHGVLNMKAPKKGFSSPKETTIPVEYTEK